MPYRPAGLFIIALLIAQAVNAHAEEDSGRRWSQAPDTILRVDNSDVGTQANFYSFSRLIRTTGNENPVVILNCQAMSTGQHSLNAAIQLDPANTYEEDPSERFRLLSVSAALTIDGVKKSERFKYHPASSKIIPYDKAVAKKLYNAVVNGSEVMLKVKGKQYDLALPAKDAVVFIAFAKTCPTTNGGQFDASIFEQVKARATETQN
ncbi:MAG: hypothetical protein IE925_07905 [Rhodobacterales bacterium]|nr:hypothetical protein [Rhodobacterales bacterium]